MVAKTNGAEWKRFYQDKEFWPEGRWHDDELIQINGQDAGDDCDLTEIPDDAIVHVEGGAVLEDGSLHDSIDSLEGHFKKWRKKQTTESIVIEVDKSKVEEIKAALKSMGAKIVK